MSKAEESIKANLEELKNSAPLNPWGRAVIHYDDPEKELKFKNKVGTFKTSALFLETSTRYGDLEDSPQREGVLYTLKDNDFRGYPSLRRLYLEQKDPTEYSFANNYFYSWEHWCMIRNQEWIKPKLDKWREELDVLINAEALTTVVEEATNPISRSRLAAAKFLLEMKYGASEGHLLKGKAKDKQDHLNELSAKEREKAEMIQQRAKELLKERQKLNTKDDDSVVIN